jgi:hypothetical protein
VSTIEELLGKKSSGFGLESQEYGHRDPLKGGCMFSDIFYWYETIICIFLTGWAAYSA